MELTGTNRSNPLDPNAVPSASRGKPGPPSACSGKRQRTGRSQQDASPRAFANPAFRTPRNPPVFQEGPWAPGSTHRSSRWAEGPRGLPSTKAGAPKAHRKSLGPGSAPRSVGGLKVHRGSLRPRPARQRRTGVSGRFGQPGGHSEGQNTRSHPELGRENPQRRWYCRSSGGRAGRRQARQTPLHPRAIARPLQQRPGPPIKPAAPTKPTAAGWSSPVARQAHNWPETRRRPAPMVERHPRT